MVIFGSPVSSAWLYRLSVRTLAFQARKQGSTPCRVTGNDILLYVATKEIIEQAYNAVLNAVRNGDVSEERIDLSVYRILTLKKKLI